MQLSFVLHMSICSAPPLLNSYLCVLFALTNRHPLHASYVTPPPPFPSRCACTTWFLLHYQSLYFLPFSLPTIPSLLPPPSLHPPSPNTAHLCEIQCDQRAGLCPAWHSLHICADYPQTAHPGLASQRDG